MSAKAAEAQKVADELRRRTKALLMARDDLVAALDRVDELGLPYPEACGATALAAALMEVDDRVCLKDLEEEVEEIISLFERGLEGKRMEKMAEMARTFAAATEYIEREMRRSAQADD